ncbi:hypothetical protein RDABS01_013501, partial [Bienertia sinuspersici]
SSTTINDLFDELLIEIFARLGSYEIVIRSKLVSKHLLSLLSNPKFVIEYLKHKSNLPLHKKEQQPHGQIPSRKVFSCFNLSLNFLPCWSWFEVVTTYKDLVLCLDLSKEKDHDNHHQDPYLNEREGNIDCRLRVVVAHPIPRRTTGRSVDDHDPYKILNLMVYCSENSLWKKIHLRVPLSIPKRNHVESLGFKGVLCKGMVCIRLIAHYGMFNPFDVTPNTNTNTNISDEDELEARKMRPPCFPHGRKNLECDERLISIYNSYIVIPPNPARNRHGAVNV